MVQADLDDPATILPAFKGAHAIYSITDFWQFYKPANASKLKPGQKMNEFAYDCEIQQGKSIAIAAAQVETLERFVCSSLSNAKKWSRGIYSCVYHFDSKAAIVEYIHDNLPALAKKMSVIQIGLYATHWQGLPFAAPQKQPDGTFVLSLSADPDKPMPMLDSRRDTGHFVRALVQLPPGKNLLAYGSMISWSAYMALWAKTLGLPGGSYRQLTTEEVIEVAGDPDLGREVAEGWKYQGEFGYDGGDPSVVHPKDVSLQFNSFELLIRCKHELMVYLIAWDQNCNDKY